MRIIVTGGNSGVGRATAGAMAAAVSRRTWASIHFDDVNFRERRYSPWAAYAESRLANLLFVRELTARGVTAYASHPGMTDTGITRNGSGALRWAGRVISPRIAQSPADGARSTIQAITTTLPNGTYLAPRGPLHQWGRPKPAILMKKVRDGARARRLWALSEELTGCRWKDAQ